MVSFRIILGGFRVYLGLCSFILGAGLGLI